jgi:hypothetical protein
VARLHSLLLEQGFTVQPVDSTALRADHVVHTARERAGFRVLAVPLSPPVGPASALPRRDTTQLVLVVQQAPFRVSYRHRRGQQRRLGMQAFRLLEAAAKAYPGARLQYRLGQ